MRFKLTLFLFLFLFLFPFLFLAPAGAQELPEQLQESLNERNESETEDEDLLMSVLERQRNPINLNTCDLPELLSIPGLSPSLAAAILQHRERTGPFQSVYELQTIEGMDRELFLTLEKLVSFSKVFVVGRTKTLEGLFADEQSPSKVRGTNSFEYLLLLTPLLQQRKGYTEGIYAGSPLRQWHRLQWKANDFFRLGLNMENDAGEAFRWNSKQRGFDFYSGFVEYQGHDKRNKIILGDYMTASGQGLVHGRGRGFGSQTWVGRVYAAGQSRVYRSSEENLFYRGALVQHAFGRGIHKAFVSFHREDGGEAETETVSKGTGMHRTEGEYAMKKGFRRLLAGQSIEYPLGKWKLGLQYLYRYEEGKNAFQTGLSHSWQSGNMLLFGEVALDEKKSLSLLEGLVWSLDKHLDMSILFRHYPAEQSNPLASGFSSFSRPENETGLYLSSEWKPTRRSTWRAYVDQAYRPNPSYLVSTPYMATAYFIETEQKLYGAKLLMRLREDRGKKDESGEEQVWKHTLDWKKRSIRIQLDWQQGRDISQRTRLEYCTYKHGIESHKGYLLFHEVQWRPEQKKWYWILRYQYFFTPDYNARIYAYESDVLYAYSVPAFSGRGQRFYLVTRRNLFKRLDLWLKLGFTNYDDKTEVGSGNDLLKASRVWDGKVELRWTM